jgi:hypothetical protein
MYTRKYISGCGCRSLGDVNAPGVDASTATAEPASYMTTLTPGQAASVNVNSSKQNTGAGAPVSSLSEFFNRPFGDSGINYGQAMCFGAGLLLLIAFARRR